MQDAQKMHDTKSIFEVSQEKKPKYFLMKITFYDLYKLINFGQFDYDQLDYENCYIRMMAKKCTVQIKIS